jgi:hypothetical protein
MTEHSNIRHVTYINLILRQTIYNRRRMLGNDTDSYDIIQMWVVSAYSQQTTNTQPYYLISYIHKTFCSKKICIPEVEINRVYYINVTIFV